MNTKKNSKILALLLALAMVFVMSVPAFADTETSTHTVNIYVQEAERATDDSIVSTTVHNNGQPVTVTVNDGATLKDAINIACNTPGSYISNVVWNTDFPEFLTALSLDEEVRQNQDNYIYDYPEVGKTTYQGLSWMYFNGNPSMMPASSYTYPDVSLGAKIVTEDTTITLSYESLTFVW